MLFLVSTQTGVGLCDRDVYIYDLSAGGGGGGASISGCRKSLFSFSFPQKNNRTDFTHLNSNKRRSPEKIYRFFDSGQVPPPPEAKVGILLNAVAGGPSQEVEELQKHSCCWSSRADCDQPAGSQ